MYRMMEEISISRILLVFGFVAVGLMFNSSAWAQEVHSDHVVTTQRSSSPEHGHDVVSEDGSHASGAHQEHEAHGGHDTEGHGPVPSIVATAPFITILMCIAILPLIHRTEHWWHKNKNKFIVSVILAGITLIYYLLRSNGFHAAPGWPSVGKVLQHAVLDEYIPFIVLLFSLYTISGGIQLRGDLKATPGTNVTFIAVGALMASFVGTTGASMLLIRPLLQTNKEREYVRHTVIFFIFLVSNIGGSLLPIGDPPLFLGYLRGVPFLWTLGLWKPWLFCCLLLLCIYYVWDSRLYKKEPPLDHLMDETHIEPLKVRGLLNFVWLLGVVLSVALLVPGKPFLGKYFVVPPYLREAAQLGFVAIAWLTSSAKIREENKFDFFAIIEVAALFVGIFITMQVPIEILNIKGSQLGLTQPFHFFWATGVLSSFLDNAPTYVVFFETAKSLPVIEGLTYVADVSQKMLVAISLGAVFMGANTYIGNGPNFMVKSIAEQSGVKMPSFFGYMFFSGAILIPCFILVMAIFLL